jgi:predicted AAA+ superfamily ATPase
MKRSATDDLLAWTESSRRRPLVVRGARQVGKTWAVNDLGSRRFAGHMHTIDLERRRDLHLLFEGGLDTRRILSELETALGSRIVPGRDLLFIDEIQACPRAIVALRYFYEDVPELHVIAAGSLLEFALESISVPVGRVQYLWLHPMTFAEYLQGVGNDVAADVVGMGPHPVGETTHAALLQHLKDYLFVGGMPAAVGAFSQTGRLLDAFAVQEDILASYRDDFLKYRPRTGIDTLHDVLVSLGRSVGDQIILSKLSDRGAHGTISKALTLLERAQLVRRIDAVHHLGLPLDARATRRFKAIVVDVGLMQRLAGLPASVELRHEDLLAIHNGAVAEQFVGQELAARASGHEHLHYWSRNARGSSAEVDYVVRLGARARPLEVKSGPAGRLRSLHLLLGQHPEAAPGIVLSTAPYAELPEHSILFAPLYFAGSLERLADHEGAR